MVLFSYNQLEEHEGQKNSRRLVVRVTERAIDRRGQRLLLPEIEVEGWWTSHNRTDQLGKMGFGVWSSGWGWHAG